MLATTVIAGLEFTGVLGVMFHGSWTLSATVVPLGVACLWRGASLATTLPFATLRRGGHVKLLAALRAATAVATFVAALATLPSHNLTAIFTAMLLGELLQATIYEFARRRLAARETKELA